MCVCVGPYKMNDLIGIFRKNWKRLSPRHEKSVRSLMAILSYDTYMGLIAVAVQVTQRPTITANCQLSSD